MKSFIEILADVIAIAMFQQPTTAEHVPFCGPDDARIESRYGAPGNRFSR